MCNHSMAAVPSHSFGATLLTLAGCCIGLRGPADVHQNSGAPARADLRAALAGFGVLFLGLLALAAVLIPCMLAVVHLVVA